MGPLACVEAVAPKLPVRKPPMNEDADELPIRRLPAVDMGGRVSGQPRPPSLNPSHPWHEPLAPPCCSTKGSSVKGTTSNHHRITDHTADQAGRCQRPACHLC